MEIYYENTKGEKLNLVKWPYRIYKGDLLDYVWSYQYTSRRYGGRIHEFTKPVKEHKITLSVAAESRKTYHEVLEHFYRTAEVDVFRGTPGRLYVNGSYLNCYILESSKTDWEGDCDSLDNEIKIVAETPFWIEEESFYFPIQSQEAVPYTYLDYPYGYPYDYMPSQDNFALISSHFMDSEFILQFYGPCEHPLVQIGDYVYGVNTYVPEGYRAEIDSANKTVRLINGTGEWENVFHLRTLQNNVFQKIIPGKNTVQRYGAFEMVVILRNERSEPAWT